MTIFSKLEDTFGDVSGLPLLGKNTGLAPAHYWSADTIDQPIGSLVNSWVSDSGHTAATVASDHRPTLQEENGVKFLRFGQDSQQRLATAADGSLSVPGAAIGAIAIVFRKASGSIPFGLMNMRNQEYSTTASDGRIRVGNDGQLAVAAMGLNTFLPSNQTHYNLNGNWSVIAFENVGSPSYVGDGEYVTTTETTSYGKIDDIWIGRDAALGNNMGVVDIAEVAAFAQGKTKNELYKIHDAVSGRF